MAKQPDHFFPLELRRVVIAELETVMARFKQLAIEGSWSWPTYDLAERVIKERIEELKARDE